MLIQVGMDIPQFMDLESKTAAASTGAGPSGLALLPLEERQKKVLESIRTAASGMGPLTAGAEAQKAERRWVEETPGP